MSINIKKYTKEQMAKMVEEAQEKVAALEAEATELHEQLAISNKAAIAASEEYQENTAKLRGRIAAHIDTINQMNGEAINKANEIANLKADADVLRNKLAESEEELSKHRAATVKRLDELKKQLADTEAALERANAAVAERRATFNRVVADRENAVQRANYAENHPWRNLWAWIKRTLKMN